MKTDWNKPSPDACAVTTLERSEDIADVLASQMTLGAVPHAVWTPGGLIRRNSFTTPLRSWMKMPLEHVPTVTDVLLTGTARELEHLAFRDIGV